MRTEILTERERTILKRFLETGNFTDRMLKFRIGKNFSTITQDYELLKQAIEKLRNYKA